eukprot:CAMPEP_0173385736 /NCGR_PEP_ID=MMETSP1356-20130122/8338_1 /TAXON_ID=77927 ORGANISM="Hemiselmis virescens, Strain PCC157" /NCGR_SAMPLE_ID=MMETSP1356 /ASSEMBLY_ACC=CAM_ASM_000847 /LENGTH=204 /DNA_ID=CAMNT_0014341665 /DNA_START=33 /DNA_END=647 /DNA_ORIENTATION=-
MRLFAVVLLTLAATTEAFTPSTMLRATSSRLMASSGLRPARKAVSGLRMVSFDVEEVLKEKGIVLPNAAPPAANYVPYVITGKYLFIAGQIPMVNGELKFVGKVPTTYSLEEAYQCARTCGLNILSQAKAACGGDLKKIKKIVKLVGFVSCEPDFYDQPKVINGASDLMAEVFGEAGRHARSAVGVNVLPLNVATEVEAIIELE